MSGHSKWSNIQHRKERQDAKKAKFFTKAAKNIILAAKAGGNDPLHNSSLRLAIAKAKAVNLPNDRIENAIKKGTGELAGGDYQEVVYEGYAPGGVAILIEAVTDNRNRTVADIRHIMTKNGGSIGEAGCVVWMFDKKGLLILPKAGNTADKLLEIGLEAGIEDLRDVGEVFEIYTAPEDFSVVQKVFEESRLKLEHAGLAMLPKNLVPVDAVMAQKNITLIDALEDNDDVQNVYVNAKFPDDFIGS